MISKKNFLFFIHLFEKHDLAQEISPESQEIYNKELLLENFEAMQKIQQEIEQNLLNFYKHLKGKHPRLSLLSDQEIFEIGLKINKPKEMLQIIQGCFLGIKEFEIESQTANNKEILSINGFETTNNEKIFIKNPIKLEMSNKYELYFLDLVGRIEESMRDYLKNNIMKAIQNLFQYSLDYTNLFKSLTNKQNCFQSLFLVNDLLFFYEITHFLKVCQLKNLNLDKELQLLKEKIVRKFVEFKEFFFIQFTSSFSRTLHYSFVQFSLQILSHLNIIDYFINSQIREISCFEYIVIPKFSFEIAKTHLKTSLHESIHEIIHSNSQELDENMENYSAKSCYFRNILKDDKVKISLLAMNYKINYGYELAPKFPRGLVHETSFKALIHLMSSIASFLGVVLRGEPTAGKENTIKTIGVQLAKPLFFIGNLFLFFRIIPEISFRC